MVRHIFVCQIIDCCSVSGTRIELTVREPLNSFLLEFSCTVETNKGPFKSCIMSKWKR